MASNNVLPQRIHWMDNLRTIIILLVVLYHVGGVYEAAGLWGWFWIVDDPATITWVGIVGIVFDIVVMPTLFLISGFLAPASLQSKTSWEFLVGKVRRLLLPWALAVITLIPLYKVIFLYSRGLPQEPWYTYFHITNPNSQNWLWFLPVLFLFNMLYLLGTRAGFKLPVIPLRAAGAGAFIVGLIYSISIGIIFGARSWTLTPVLDFENERLLVYFLAFLFGALCYRQNVFAQKPQGQLWYIVINAIAWIPITVHIFARLIPFFDPQGFVVTPLYLLFWWLSFDLALLCLLYLMIATFQRYVDRTGWLWSELNRNSYGVYIIHVIMIGVFGTLLLNLNVPALVKYPVLFVATYAASNLLVSGYRNLVSAVRSSLNRPVAQPTP